MLALRDVDQVVRSCVGMNEVFRVDSPSGALDFFLHAADDLHRYVSRLTGGDLELTEDIVQETFIALLRHPREGRDALMQPGWLMTTARNRFIDHMRSRHRELLRLERHASREPAGSQEFEIAFVSAEQARWMLASLPPHERLALALHSVDGLPVSDVAAAIGRTVEATTSLLARARRRLRAMMMESTIE
jgi:RNA polymerase sigma-70 factor, ECF subfamily